MQSGDSGRGGACALSTVLRGTTTRHASDHGLGSFRPPPASAYRQRLHGMLALYAGHTWQALQRMYTKAGIWLDRTATAALVLSGGLLLVLLAQLLHEALGPAASDPHNLSRLGEAIAFVALFSAPTLGAAIAWPMHLRNKRKGLRVFGWLRFAVLASALWMGLIFAALSGL